MSLYEAFRIEANPGSTVLLTLYTYDLSAYLVGSCEQNTLHDRAHALRVVCLISCQI